MENLTNGEIAYEEMRQACEEDELERLQRFLDRLHGSDLTNTIISSI